MVLEPNFTIHYYIFEKNKQDLFIRDHFFLDNYTFGLFYQPFSVSIPIQIDIYILQHLFLLTFILFNLNSNQPEFKSTFNELNDLYSIQSIFI